MLWTTVSVDVKAQDAVKVCDDISPWPPYSYSSPTGEGDIAHKRAGAMVDFLDDLFKEIGLEYTLSLMPWKRCLEAVKKSFGPGDFEVVINASFSSERAKNYHVSKPIYRTTPGAFYSVDAFPAGLNLRSRSDLKNYKICGVRGYNYLEYGLSDSDISSISGSLKTIFKMMGKGRCEVIVSSIEPALGTKLFGDQIVPRNVRAVSVPDAPPATFHILVSRGSSSGLLLLERLNVAIEKFMNDGTWDRIMGKYQALMDAK
jgi:polar amino acid transport system substrate-binding protein